LEAPANPGWPFAAIHHGPDLNCFLLQSVVDREREPLAQGAVKSAVHLPMDASEYLQALDVRIQVDQKITPKPFLLALIEIKALDQVVPGEVKNLKPH
jgi:hypothetical protein